MGIGNKANREYGTMGKWKIYKRNRTENDKFFVLTTDCLLQRRSIIKAFIMRFSFKFKWTKGYLHFFNTIFISRKPNYFETHILFILGHKIILKIIKIITGKVLTLKVFVICDKETPYAET